MQLSSMATNMSCECGYKNVNNMSRHLRACVARSFAVQLQQLTEEGLRKTRRFESEIERLKLENAALTQNLAAERARPIVNNTTMNNTTTVVNNDNRTVNILPYGEEPLPKRQDVLPLLYNPERSVARYIEMKHFSSRETANMRIPNKRARTMQLVEQARDGTKRWVEVDRKETIDKLTEENLIELTDMQDAAKVPVWREWYVNRGFNSDGYERTDAWRKLGTSVENLLLSQRNGNLL
jgi:hypothetical protein